VAAIHLEEAAVAEITKLKRLFKPLLQHRSLPLNNPTNPNPYNRPLPQHPSQNPTTLEAQKC
jgi:hypothetical protein